MMSDQQRSGGVKSLGGFRVVMALALGQQGQVPQRSAVIIEEGVEVV